MREFQVTISVASSVALTNDADSWLVENWAITYTRKIPINITESSSRSSCFIQFFDETMHLTSHGDEANQTNQSVHIGTRLTTWMCTVAVIQRKNDQYESHISVQQNVYQRFSRSKARVFSHRHLAHLSPNCYRAKVRNMALIFGTIAFVPPAVRNIIQNPWTPMRPKIFIIPETQLTLVFTALNWMQGGLVARKVSVCPSVYQTRGLWQNGRKICPDFLYHTKDHLA